MGWQLQQTRCLDPARVDCHWLVLVRIVPFNRDCGQFQGRRMIGDGRASALRILYMATVAAIRVNPVIQTLLHAPSSPEQTQEGRLGCRHAQVVDPLQRGDERPDPLADTALDYARDLTFDTVAVSQGVRGHGRHSRQGKERPSICRGHWLH